MARSGNLNLSAQVRVVQTVAPSSAFVALTNNGGFTGIVNNGNGIATLTLDAEFALAPADTVHVTIEGAVGTGEIAVVARLTPTTIQISCFANLAVPLASPADYAVTTVKRFVG